MLNLPSNVVAVVLCDWLDCYSLARLDAAQCNRLDRSEYLNVLSSNEVTLHTLSNRSRLGSSVLKWVSHRSVKVRKVRFSFYESVDEATAVAFLTTVGQGLDELKLQFTHPSAIDILCRKASSLCSHLRSIHLHGNGKISGELLTLVLRNCAPTLTSLRLEYVANVPRFSTCSSMPAMRCLSFTPEGDLRQFDVPSVVNLIRNGPNLVTFSFVGNEELAMPGGFLAALAEHCRQLQTLRCEVFESFVSDYQRLLENCPDLHTVDLTRTGKSAVQTTLLYCRKLRTLRTNSIGDEEVHMIPLLSARMPQMEHLCLEYFSCRTAAPIRILADQCFNLRSLTINLSRGQKFPPADAFRLLLQNLVRVEMLDIWDKGWLTDDLLLVVAAHCKRLSSIALDGSGLQVATVTALVTGCPQLTTIHHSIFDRTLSSASNREMWRTLRPGLTLLASASAPFEHWSSLVFDGIVM